MRAVTCSEGVLKVTDVPVPQPGNGQLLVNVQRCGICGSDLHARTHCDDLAEVLDLCGYDRYMRSEHEVVFGHEIYGVVADQGPQTRGSFPVGTPVVALPLVRQDTQVDGVGLSQHAPGGYAEQVVVQESLTLRVPDSLSPDIAALTEPMAVALHAVNRGAVAKKDVAVVIGCGPVGLAVILLLKSRGVRTVIASDPSAGRRALAGRCGADRVVDPTHESPYAAATTDAHFSTMPQAYNTVIDALESVGKLPVPWWHVWRVLDKVGITDPKAPVVFECVGVPGMIDDILAQAPLFSRAVIVGVCMGSDAVRPSLAINKEIDLRFVVGYTPLEFRDSLHTLASGKVDPTPLLTGTVGLDGVEGAFTALGDPETHAKILIDPSIKGSDIVTT